MVVVDTITVKDVNKIARTMSNTDKIVKIQEQNTELYINDLQTCTITTSRRDRITHKKNKITVEPFSGLNPTTLEFMYGPSYEIYGQFSIPQMQKFTRERGGDSPERNAKFFFNDETTNKSGKFRATAADRKEAKIVPGIFKLFYEIECVVTEANLNTMTDPVVQLSYCPLEFDYIDLKPQYIFDNTTSQRGICKACIPKEVISYDQLISCTKYKLIHLNDEPLYLQIWNEQEIEIENTHFYIVYFQVIE